MGWGSQWGRRRREIYLVSWVSAAVVATPPSSHRRPVVVAASSLRRHRCIVAASSTSSRHRLGGCPHSPPQLGALTSRRAGALTSRRPRRVVVASSHRAVSSPPLFTAILTRVLIPRPQCWSSRRRVAVPAPILTAILTARSSPLVAAVVAYTASSPILGESMRRCSDCEGLGGCSEACVVVASSSRRRRPRVALFCGGKNLYASW